MFKYEAILGNKRAIFPDKAAVVKNVGTPYSVSVRNGCSLFGKTCYSKLPRVQKTDFSTCPTQER